MRTFRSWPAAAVLTALVASFAPAQAPIRPYVRATGSATISVTPDLVHVSVMVTTQAATAQEAADNNAAQSTRVINALKALVGAKGDIKTISYSVNQLSRTNNNVTTTFFQATNGVQVNAEDLNLGSRIIDTALQAGATSVGGIYFGLKDDANARMQALKQATARAKANVEAIASGLGGRASTVLSVEESSAVRVLAAADARLGIGLAAGATPTPIESGLVTVQANVVLQADLIQ